MHWLFQDSIIHATDGYKHTHEAVLPAGTRFVRSYTEARGGRFPWTLWAGLQGVLKDHLVGEVLKQEDIEEAVDFYGQYYGRSGVFLPEPWRRMFAKYGGRLPVSIRALPEGSVVNVRNALSTIENTDGEFPGLPNKLESILLHVWSPMATGTLSREIKKLLIRKLTLSGVAPEAIPGMVEQMLVDFGFRGVSSLQSACRAGTGHLISFRSSDNIPAVRYAMRTYGAGVCGGTIPATEHFVMTIRGRAGEADAVDALLNAYPEGAIACVGDSYDIFAFIREVLGPRKEKILARNGKFITRPDSGDPAEVSRECLNHLGQVFGFSENQSNYRVLPPQVGGIYGDKIDYVAIDVITDTIMEAGWSVENQGYGMGGALLQAPNRDTHEMATKCWSAEVDGEEVEVYKKPLHMSEAKASKRGRHKVVLRDGKHGQVYHTVPLKEDGEDLLREVFRDGELLVEEKWDDIVARASANYIV